VNAQARFDVSTGGELLGVLSAATTGPLDFGHRCASRQVGVLGVNAADVDDWPAGDLAAVAGVIATVGRTNSAEGLG
jgi:hypothetical protein